jgi:phosphatidylinositol glycan class K
MNALSDLPYNSRNVAPGKVINSNTLDYGFDELYEDTEVDYSRSETTVDSFLQVLTGRGHSTSGRKVLQSSESSKVLIYLTGHGGDQFLKFQDNEELTSEDLGKAIKEMELKHMFGEMLLIADTCQVVCG